MKNKILFLGNSYLGAIKKAWDSTEDKPDCEADFIFGTGMTLFDQLVASPIEGTYKLSLKENAPNHLKETWALTLGDRSSLELAEYQEIIIVGLIRPPSARRMSSCSLDLDQGIYYITGKQPISFAVWLESSRDYYNFTLAESLINTLQLGNGNKKPKISLIPSTFIREDAAEFDVKYAAPKYFQNIEVNSKWKMYFNECLLVQRWASERGVNVVDYPKHLVIDGHMCPKEFSKETIGSVDSSGKFKEWGDTPLESKHNYFHKNKEFGLEMLKLLFTSLKD